jgi:hypothetical protein
MRVMPLWVPTGFVLKFVCGGEIGIVGAHVQVKLTTECLQSLHHLYITERATTRNSGQAREEETA